MRFILTKIRTSWSKPGSLRPLVPYVTSRWQHVDKYLELKCNERVLLTSDIRVFFPCYGVGGCSVICPVNCFCKRIQSDSELDVFAVLDSDTFTVFIRAETAGKTKWLVYLAHYQYGWIWYPCLLIIWSQLPLFCRSRDIPVDTITTGWTSCSGGRFIASPDMFKSANSILSSGYSKHFPLHKEDLGVWGVWSWTIRFHLVLLRLRRTEPIAAFSHTSLWHGA
jgi:hypothetical protein